VDWFLSFRGFGVDHVAAPCMGHEMCSTVQILMACLCLLGPGSAMEIDTGNSGARSVVDGIATALSNELILAVRADPGNESSSLPEADPEAGHFETGEPRMSVLEQILAGTLTGTIMAVLAMRFVFRRRRKP
jgi:hypothetical protein